MHRYGRYEAPRSFPPPPLIRSRDVNSAQPDKLDTSGRAPKDAPVADHEPLPKINTRIRYKAHNKGSFPVAEFSIICGLIAVFGIVLLLFLQLLLDPSKQNSSRSSQNGHPASPGQTTPTNDKLTLAQGGGKFQKPQDWQPPAKKASTPSVPANIDDLREHIDAYVVAGIEECKKGFFEAADAIGAKADKLWPDDDRGLAIRLLAGYLQQYHDRFADEAFDAMGPSTEIDLGPKYGIGAFVERQGDVVVFLAEGKRVTFTRDEFNLIDGLRFRLTQRYFDAGQKPANNLILGALHYVKNVDQDGRYHADSKIGRELAATRWKTAQSSMDERVAEHATALLKLPGTDWD